MNDTDGGMTAEITNRDVAKGAGTTLLARLGGVLEVVTQPLYIWLFGLAGYGFYGALWAAINLTQNIADLGTTGAMQRVVPQAGSPAREASALRAAMILGMVPCILIAIIVTLLAEPVSRFFNANARDTARAAETVALFVWALPLWSFVEIATSALRSRRVFGAEIRLRVFWEQIIRVLMVVALFGLGFSTQALFIGHLVSLAMICLLCVRLLSKHFDLRLMLNGPVFDDVFWKTLQAALAVLPANATLRLFGDGPAIALNAILPGASGAVATSLYIIARKVSSVVQLVRTAFAYVLSPLASAASAGGKAQVQSIYGFSSRLLIALALPMAMVLGAMGPAILPLFGPGAEAAMVALGILLAARAIEAVCGAAQPIQQVISLHRQQLVGSVVGVGIAAMIAGALMPEHGLNAMALAVGVGLVVAAVIPMAQLRWHDDLHPFASPFFRVLAKSAAVAVAGGLLALAVQLLPPLVQRGVFAMLVLASLKVSWKLALGLAVFGGLEWAAEFYAVMPEVVLSHLLELTLLLPILIASLWASLRVALPQDDRVAIGDSTARRLRLI